MKNLLHFYLISLGVVFIISCSSDPCEDVICFNDGICVDGSCDCLPGWSGVNCSTYDFEYIGRYSSTSFTITNCSNDTNNGTFRADADEEYCLINDDGNEQCLRITLILEEDNAARFIQVQSEVIGNIKFSEPTVIQGTYTTQNELITFNADGGGTVIFTVKEDRSALQWIQPNSGTDGCEVIHDFVKSV